MLNFNQLLNILNKMLKPNLHQYYSFIGQFPLFFIPLFHLEFTNLVK